MRGMIFDANVGSSPRMRGTQMQPVGHIVDSGIIPAHAGNTCGFEFGRVVGGDHPRACGEHSHVTLQSLKLVGSSPRMRGTLPIGQALAHIPGIIPAHAGNTHTHRMARGDVGDHPRACGEHYGFRRLACHRFGIIPAHAGNTTVK